MYFLLLLVTLMFYFNFGNSKDDPDHLHSALESDNTPQIIKNGGKI